MRSLLVAVLLVSGGCSDKAKCISATTKLDEKMESCGLSAARPKEEIEKLCAEVKTYAGSEGAKLDDYLLSAPSCEALKLREEEVVRKAEQDDQRQRQAELERLKAEQQKQFNDAFQKAVNEKGAAQQKAKGKTEPSSGLGL